MQVLLEFFANNKDFEKIELISQYFKFNWTSLLKVYADEPHKCFELWKKTDGARLDEIISDAESNPKVRA